MSKIKIVILLVALLAKPSFAVFNNIVDGDYLLAAPVMQNFRHVNYGNDLKPVDANGVNSHNAIDLGTNTVQWKDGYFAGNISIGGTAEAKIHVIESDATVAPHADADALVLERNGTTGMSFLSNNTSNQFIMFGDSDDNDVGGFKYSHSSESMVWTVNAATVLTLTNSGSADLYLDAGTGTNADLILEMGSGGGGANKSRVSYKNSASNEIFFTEFDNSAGNFIIGSDLATSGLVMPRTTGYVGIGAAPSNVLLVSGSTDVNGSQIRISNPDSGGNDWVLGVGKTGSNASIVDPGGLFIYNTTSSGTALRIDTDGLVEFPDGVDATNEVSFTNNTHGESTTLNFLTENAGGTEKSGTLEYDPDEEEFSISAPLTNTDPQYVTLKGLVSGTSTSNPHFNELLSGDSEMWSVSNRDKVYIQHNGVYMVNVSGTLESDNTTIEGLHIYVRSSTSGDVLYRTFGTTRTEAEIDVSYTFYKSYVAGEHVYLTWGDNGAGVTAANTSHGIFFTVAKMY